MSKLLIDCCDVHGTPMFFSEPYYSEEQKRIYGYKDSKRRGVALYPGFLPIARHTVNDLEIVFGDRLEWTPDAAELRDHIRCATECVEKAKLPRDFSFVLPPYDHQKEALVKGYWEERTAIFHDCGLGKTKTIIDVFRLLKDEQGEEFRALVVCPSHLVRNWKREIEKHTFSEELSSFVMVDQNNNSLDPDTRTEIYTGERLLNPDPSWRYYDEYPNLYYEPLPDGLPGDIYDHERAYVEAIVNDDSKERRNARNRMRYRAKKHDFELTSGERWRVLDPPPTPAREFDVLVMSYDVMVADEELIEKHYPFTVIAADESHYLRGYKSERTKAACRLAKRAPRRYLMSGTPSLGHPMHMYGQLRFLSPVFIGGWFKYTRRYLVKAKHNPKMTVGFKNLHVLNMVVNDVAHRRKQEECLDLPPKRIIEVPVEVDDKTRHIYNELVATWSTSLPMADDEDARLVEVQQAPDRLNKLLQVLSGFYIDANKDAELCEGCPFLMECVANGDQPYTEDCMVATEDPPKKIVRLEEQPRLEMAAELVNDVLQEDKNKIIIWCNYTEELNMVEERLDKVGVGYVRVDGSTRNKVDCEDRFREDPDCRVYLSHISISEGLTLNAANYVIYYGLTYDLKDYVQSMKRNYRIGQERPVTIYHLVTPGSIHRYILDALERKQDIADTMTDAIRCGTCERYKQCQENNVQPFETDCLYSPSKRRVITRPALL